VIEACLQESLVKLLRMAGIPLRLLRFREDLLADHPAAEIHT
jgi:hypothetical protein